MAFVETAKFLIFATNGNTISLVDRMMRICQQIVIEQGTVSRLAIIDDNQTLAFFTTAGQL